MVTLLGGECGYLSTPQTAESFATIISDIILNPNHQTIVSNALEKMRGNYSLNAMAHQYHDCYKTLQEN